MNVFLENLDAKLGEQFGVLPSGVAKAAGIDPALFLSLIQTESSGRQFDASGAVLKSSAGAVGLTQLTPIAVRDLQRKGLVSPTFDATDPASNLRGGALYLKQQLAATSGDTETALRAYNAGLQGAQANPNAGKDYAAKVLALMNGTDAPGESLAGSFIGDAVDTLKGYGVSAVAWLVVGLLVVFGLYSLIAARAVVPA